MSIAVEACRLSGDTSPGVRQSPLHRYSSIHSPSLLQVAWYTRRATIAAIYTAVGMLFRAAIHDVRVEI